MKANTQFICNWVRRMSERFGGVVRDSDTGETWDWGQALCREQFGPDWVAELRRRRQDDPDDESVAIAQQWESGHWPAWATHPQREQLEGEVSK